MRLAPVLLVVAVGASCASTPRVGPWRVYGPAPEPEATQAVELAEAARRLYPTGALVAGAEIVLLPDLEAVCGPGALPPPLRFAGCLRDRVYVLWPHPKCPAGADLTCSALAHELCHAALPMSDDREAEACAARVVAEYRKGAP